MLVFLLALTSRTAEFSANMIQNMHGQTQTGKVLIKGKKMRMEMNAPGYQKMPMPGMGSHGMPHGMRYPAKN